MATPMERQKDKSKKNPKKLDSAEIEFLEHKMDKVVKEIKVDKKNKIENHNELWERV